MANYYGYARTSSFKVKDVDEFKKSLEKFDVEIYDDGNNFVTVLSSAEEGWQSHVYDDEGFDLIEVDPIEEMAKHLEDDEVLIAVMIGHEKLRYIDGWAQAINNKLESRFVSLYNIYGLAKELGENFKEVNR